MAATPVAPLGALLDGEAALVVPEVGPPPDAVLEGPLAEGLGVTLGEVALDSGAEEDAEPVAETDETVLGLIGGGTMNDEDTVDKIERGSEIELWLGIGGPRVGILIEDWAAA